MSSEEDDGVPLLDPFRLEDTRSKLYLKDYFAGLVSFLMVCLGIAAIVVLYVYQTKILNEYGVVLDAGSTHTNLMVYKWSRHDILQGTALVEQIGMCNSTGESISSFLATDPLKAGTSLQGCIDSTAKKLIPSYLRSMSPIYLGATAGMRLVEKTNIVAAKKIMSSVRQTLSRSSFKFEDDYARIISGEEEGLSSWVTVNYLQGSLLYRKIKTNSSEESIKHLQGALDMGGASTQITFALSREMKIPTRYKHHLRLYGRDYHLYTHSYLCYGKKEAERRFMASLVKNLSSGNGTMPATDNPCGPKDLIQNVTRQYLWQPPCVNAPTPEGSRGNFTFHGTANVSQCAEKVRNLFNFTNCPLDSNCSFNGVYQPSTDDVKFVAFSSYYYVASTLNLTRNGDYGNVSLMDFKEAADQFCSKSWSRVKYNVPPSRQQFMKSLCFDAQFVYTFLSRAYHIKDKSRNVAFSNTLHRRDLGWALGFMINATNLMPSEKPEYRVKAEVFVAVIIVGAILISLGVLIAIMATRRVIYRRRITPSGLTI